MEKINWDVDNYNKETPRFIKYIYRILGFLTAMWVLAIEPRCPGISIAVKHAILTISVVGTYGIYYFCQYFGFKQPDKVEGAPEINDQTPGTK